MPLGFVIPASMSRPITLCSFEDIRDLQDAVEGHIEVIEITKPSMAILMNEEGKAHKLESNRRATMVWWRLRPEHAFADIILGDAVLIGNNVEEHCFVDVPIYLHGDKPVITL